MSKNEEVDIVHDAEANGLLDASTVDYTASPWKLKPNFKMHVVSVLEIQSKELIAFYDGPTLILDGRRHEHDDGEHKYILEDYKPLKYTHRKLSEFPEYVKQRNIKTATGHNVIGYDLLAYKAYFDLDYSIGESGDDTWGGRSVYHNDTLVLSKTLNPDRYLGHSLDQLSVSAGGDRKLEFRKAIPKDKRFEVFAADMLYYNLYDLKSNLAVKYYLEEEQGDHKWQMAINLEKSTADLINRQSHRGFAFNMGLAEENIEELDRLMQERRVRVEPVLPAKKATKKIQGDFTPPKIQFKANGEMSSHMEKFIVKIGAEKVEGGMKFQGKVHKLPLPQDKALVTEVAASIDDTTHIKDWLVGLGWSPSEWKEKDLTVDTKKNKLSFEKYKEVVKRYVLQTLECNFKGERCEFLACSPGGLERTLLSKGVDRPVRVRTNPSFTKGQDKEMCPDLDRISEQFPFARDVVEYLTYKHRRNSILGGGMDWDEGEEAEKGYLAYVRPDGRIATPADTCGAATSRMKHKVVANVPRVTSLYGGKMRGLFGADPKECYQIGYDFASLEARIEAHYCFKYEEVVEGVREYCDSLLLEKPNDVHSVLSRKISEIIGRKFERAPAKNVKYGCTYGAQAAKVAKTIGDTLEVGKIVFDAFWLAAAPLAMLKEKLKAHWESNGKKYIVTIDGRKVPTRAAHAILNSLFQSAGVICAKKAMVRWEHKLRAEGLAVDFWTEDWKTKAWGQQMIAYHDEAQIEAKKSLVKFKKFPTKEECDTFRAEQKESTGLVWSEAHESPKGGWFVAYSRVGELVVEAVAETSEFFKLNVPLSADYVVGKSWEDCH